MAGAWVLGRIVEGWLGAGKRWVCIHHAEQAGGGAHCGGRDSCGFLQDSRCRGGGLLRSSPQTHNLGMMYMYGRGHSSGQAQPEPWPRHLLTLEDHRVGREAEEGVISEASL